MKKENTAVPHHDHPEGKKENCSLCEISVWQQNSRSSWISRVFDAMGMVFLAVAIVLFFAAWMSEETKFLSFPDGTVVKNPSASARGTSVDSSSIPGSGRSPEVGNGNLLQDSCLKNSTENVHTCMQAQTHTHTHTHTHTRARNIICWAIGYSRSSKKKRKKCEPYLTPYKKINSSLNNLNINSKNSF